MTKEEAISKVKGYLTDDFPIEDYGEVEEIIKALEGKPCIDVVNRQAVLNTLDFADKALDENRTMGRMDLRLLDGTHINASVGYKNLKLLKMRSSYLIEQRKVD